MAWAAKFRTGAPNIFSVIIAGILFQPCMYTNMYRLRCAEQKAWGKCEDHRSLQNWVPSVWNCFMSPFWRLGFGCGSQIYRTFVRPYSNVWILFGEDCKLLIILFYRFLRHLPHALLTLCSNTVSTINLGFPSRGPPRCVLRPAATCVNCVYTIKITQ